MFRRRNQGGGGDLPTTMGGGGGGYSSSSSSSFLPSSLGIGSHKKNDGSARGIHLQSPVVTKWKRSSKAVKISYMVAFCSFWLIVLGWRFLTYYSAAVNMECSATDCTFTMNAVGRQGKKRLTVPRHQIIGAKPVKVNKQGVIVNDNVDMNSEWKYQNNNGGKSKNKKKSQSQNYKGPDKDGNYLSYFVTVRNKDIKQPTNENDEEAAVDLGPILPFAVKAPSQQEGTDTDGGEVEEYRIVMRQQGITQTRRRVRNMVQKIDSFAKKRRHKLTVKENAAPDWKAVLMMVFGGCSFLLSLLLGMFWEDEEEQTTRNIKSPWMSSGGGPGSRKKMSNNSQYGKRPAGGSGVGAGNVNPYQRTTPSRYEVNTQPTLRKQTSGGPGPVRRRN